MTVAGREASAHGRAVRGDHLHSVELRVRRALYLFQHARAEALEHGGSRGAQVLGAGLVAGEARAVEQQDAHPVRASNSAVGEPAGPAPTMMTSQPPTLPP